MKQGQGQRNMHAPHQPTAVWLLEAETRALETSSSRHSKKADRSFKRPLRAAVFFSPKKTRQLDLHSETATIRSFRGSFGEFFPPITHERFKRKLTRTPGPTEAQAMHHTGTQAPSQRPVDEKAEQGGRRIITSQ